MAPMRIAFTASSVSAAQEALRALTAAHGQCDPAAAQVVVALGGDGFMLQTLHATQGRDLPVYGMNCGTIGFLMNSFSLEDLPDRLAAAEETVINPLSMRAEARDGRVVEALAINEVSLLRAGPQAAKLRISIDGRVRLEELVCDGALVATPAGSTAYNLSANGPILPLGSRMLALTPISPFRPRRWRGAILPDRMKIVLKVLDPAKRPVAAVADQKELRDIAEVRLQIAQDCELTLLFDPGQSLEERIVAEQFITE